MVWMTLPLVPVTLRTNTGLRPSVFGEGLPRRPERASHPTGAAWFTTMQDTRELGKGQAEENEKLLCYAAAIRR